MTSANNMVSFVNTKLNFFIDLKKISTSSLNLSGPTCGQHECIPSAHSAVEAEEEINFSSSSHRDELCGTLCKNGLGVCV